jgi:hypothetical protein
MPELFQVVGSILRDIAQARAISDLYSRDISRYYEADPVLRRFPVPRAEISEASFSVAFLIDEVVLDENRRNARDASVSQVFETYSANVVRAALKALRKETTVLKSAGLTKDEASALDNFEARFLGEDYRNLLRARLVRFFEENQDALFPPDGKFQKDFALQHITAFIEGLVSSEPAMKDALQALATAPVPVGGAARVDAKVNAERIEREILAAVATELDSMGQEIKNVAEWAQDFKVNVEIKPDKIQAAAGAVCSITVKSTIRNYTWSKVGDDPQDIHSLRTLSPE